MKKFYLLALTALVFALHGRAYDYEHNGQKILVK